MKTLHRFGTLLIVLGVLMLLVAAPLSAQVLHEPHQGSEAECEGAVEWHFVHNQTEATEGIITVGDQQVSNGEPYEANVLHYWVTTASNVLPVDVEDNVEGGKLVLSHYTCVPVETTTTQPPEDWFTVDLVCDWDNHDKDQGAHEPILSWWDQGPDHDRMTHAFLYVIYDRVSGAHIGTVEFNTASPGYHDTWASNEVAVPDTGFIVELYLNGELIQTLDDPTCINPVETTTTTTTTEPPETTTTTTQPPEKEEDPSCDEDHPTWNAETQDCALPMTGAADLLPYFLAGLAMLGTGVMLTRASGARNAA